MTPPEAPTAIRTGPIADLSYRSYEGELSSPRWRWWVIAKMTMKMAMKKKGVWWFALGSSWYYFGMGFTLFVVDQMRQAALERNPNAPNPLDAFLGRIVWKDQFLHGFSYAQMMLLVIALYLGAGAIANDNRANALLVYLSKPCTKLDYLLGKWMGVFLPLLLVTAVPTLAFFAYGALSYRDLGFFYQDPWLFPKLLLILPLSAAFYASLVVGISALFNQGRIAGATVAGVYFLTLFFTKLMTVAWIGMTSGRGPMEDANVAFQGIVSRLFYASVDGLNIGMAKAILATDGTPYFGIEVRGLEMVPRPPLVATLAIMFVVAGGLLLLAWRRIRAVEVVV